MTRRARHPMPADVRDELIGRGLLDDFRGVDMKMDHPPSAER